MELTHVTARAAAQFPMPPPPPLRVMVARPAQATQVTQVPITLTQHDTAAAPCDMTHPMWRHRGTARPEPPPPPPRRGWVSSDWRRMYCDLCAYVRWQSSCNEWRSRERNEERALTGGVRPDVVSMGCRRGLNTVAEGSRFCGPTGAPGQPPLGRPTPCVQLRGCTIGKTHECQGRNTVAPQALCSNCVTSLANMLLQVWELTHVTARAAAHFPMVPPPPPCHGGTAGTGDTGDTSADHPHTTRHSGGPV